MTTAARTNPPAVATDNYFETIIRPNDHSNKQISFLWTPGRTLVELLYLPGQGLRFAVREGQQGIQVRETLGDFTPLGWIEPYAKLNALRLPSEAARYASLDQIAEAMRAFIHRYFECDPAFESVAVLYALHTWLRERFHAVPYLRFTGMSGSGKTRATETIGGLCYRPMFLGGAATSATIFRIIDGSMGTLLMDEADFQDSNIGTDIAKILNSGYQQGVPISRMERTGEGKYIPRVYDAFGPKIINGRRSFQDDATESRCIGHTPRPTERRDLPRQLPETFEAEARAIRNMALRWRFDKLESFQARPIFIESVRPRTNQIIAPLVLVAELLSNLRYTEDLLNYAHALEAQSLEERRDTVEARLIEVFVRWEGQRSPTCKELVDAALPDARRDDPSVDRWLTPKKAGAILKGLGFDTRHTKRGSELSIDAARLKALCARFGIVTQPSPQSPPSGDGGDNVVMISEPIVTPATLAA